MDNHHSDCFGCDGSVDSSNFWINSGGQKVLEWDAEDDADGDNQRNAQFLEEAWNDWENLAECVEETAGRSIPCFDASELDTVEEASRFVGFKRECRLGGAMAQEPSGSSEETMTKFVQDATKGYFTVRSLQPKSLQSVNARRALQDVVTEYRVLSSLVPHPNICSIAGRHKEPLNARASIAGIERFFYITNGISSTLEQKIIAWKSAATPVDLVKRMVIAVDIAGGLAHLHAHEIVAYVRPSKIGFDLRTGRVQIFDLGQARRPNLHYHPTILSMADNMDVLRYLAPECFTSGRRVTCDVDTYAFGFLLWEMAVLRVPLTGFNRSTHFDKVVCNHKRPKTSKDTIEHKELTVIIQKAWHPSKRPTMAKTQHALIKFIKPLGAVKKRRSFRGLDEAIAGVEKTKPTCHSSDTQTTEQSSVLGDQSTSNGSTGNTNHRRDIKPRKPRSRSRGPIRSKSDNKLSLSSGGLEATSNDHDAFMQEFVSNARNRAREPQRSKSITRLGLSDGDLSMSMADDDEDLMQTFIRKAIEASDKKSLVTALSSDDGTFPSQIGASPNSSFPPVASTHSRKGISTHSRTMKKNPANRKMQRHRSMAHGHVAQQQPRSSGRHSKRHSCLGSASQRASARQLSSLLPQEDINETNNDDMFQAVFPEPKFGEFNNDSPNVPPVRRVKSSDDATLHRMRRSVSSRLNCHVNKGHEESQPEEADLTSLTMDEVFSGKQTPGIMVAKDKCSSKRGRRASAKGLVSTKIASSQKPTRKASLRRLTTSDGKSGINDGALGSLGSSPAKPTPWGDVRPEPTIDQLLFDRDEEDSDGAPPSRGLIRTNSDQSHARARKVGLDKMRNDFDIGPDNLKRTLSNDALMRLEDVVKIAEPIATPKKWQGLRSLGSKLEQPTSNANLAGRTPQSKIKNRRGTLVASLLGT